MLTYSVVDLLFPGVSLLMLAYTNRFLGLAALIRQLLNEYRRHPAVAIRDQVENLSARIGLLQHVQAALIPEMLITKDLARQELIRLVPQDATQSREGCGIPKPPKPDGRTPCIS